LKVIAKGNRIIHVNFTPTKGITGENMKKKMIALIAGLMLTLSAGSAFAAFSDLNLTRIAYGSSNEVATDLGSLSSLIAAGSTTLSTGTSNLVAMGAGATGTGSSVYVAYYAASYDINTGAQSLYFSAQDNGMGSHFAINTVNAPNAVGVLANSLGGVSAYYASLPGTTDSINPAVVSATSARANLSTYFSNFEGGGAPGTSVLNGTVVALTDAPLTSATTQGLYYWDGVTGQAVEVATITTNLNGSSTINTTATPIPAAAYLLGSGLMGLFGLRRKQRA
jgi:hypothetical protein